MSDSNKKHNDMIASQLSDLIDEHREPFSIRTTFETRDRFDKIKRVLQDRINESCKGTSNRPKKLTSDKLFEMMVDLYEQNLK